MAKSQEEINKDEFQRLERNVSSLASKIGKGNSSGKGDGDEKNYSDACHAMITFGRTHGLTNLMPLKRKYRRN